MLSEARAISSGMRANGMMRRSTLPLAVAVLLLLQMRADIRLFPIWIGWADQLRYIRAADAWAAMNFDPLRHHYPPGYALMGALFVHLIPSQPFLVPDLLCSTAALVLFTRVARRLCPAMAYVEVVAAICFVGCTAIGHSSVDLWVVPWTTTAAAPLIFACLLLALRYCSSLRPANLVWMALAAGVCATIRPSDAALVLMVCSAFCILRLSSARLAPRAVVRHAAALAAGLSVGLLPGIAAHLLVHGWSLGGYIGGSASMGFEWRLIPFRWVTLVICPRPLFPQGMGMAAVFVWLLPGFAGMGLVVSGAQSRPAFANALVAATVCAYWAMYLSYRDLEPFGLWRFNNVHYFKWTFPFLGLWAIDWARAWVQPGARRRAALASAAAALLLCWRPEFVPQAHGTESTDGMRGAVPGGMQPINHVFMLPVLGRWLPLYFHETTLRVDGETFRNTSDFKIFPTPSGAMLMPLRPLPAGDATIVLGEGLTLPPRADWVSGSARLVFGVPCLVTPHSQACKVRDDIMHPPEPPMPPGKS